jgi:magnesium chelatase family protein
VSTVYGFCLRGVVAEPVRVEVVRRSDAGRPGALRLVDLHPFSDVAARETSVRVCAALASLGAEIRGEYGVRVALPGGSATAGLDLPIAVGVWACAVGCDTGGLALFGEFGLGGEIRQTRGLLAAAAGRRNHVLVANADRGLPFATPDVLHAATLGEVVAHLRGGRPEHMLKPAAHAAIEVLPDGPDLADVRSSRARRALEIAAAGRHNLLIVGAPGAGKTVLAQRLPGILPELTREELLDVATIQDAAGFPFPGLASVRPFRAPHHTCSELGLCGGGTLLRPGEVTLAHHGVLYLDELPEWRASTTARLAHALARGATDDELPAQPEVVVASMNPCPCGYLGSTSRQCRCTDTQLAAWRDRAGLGRRYPGLALPFPMVLDLGAPDLEVSEPESSAVVRERVAKARQRLTSLARGEAPLVAHTIAALVGVRISPEHHAEAHSFTWGEKSC